MLRATLRSLLARKLRLLLSALSVVLGVAFVAGSFVLTDTLRSTFDGLFTTVYAGTAVEVRGHQAFDAGRGFGAGNREQVPDAVLAAVAAVPGVRKAVGTVSGYAQLVGHDGKAVAANGNAPTTGIAWDGDATLSALRLAAGRGPTAPGEIAIDRGDAKRASFALGDRVTVLTAQAPVTETVVGVFTFGSSDSVAGASLVAFDPATVRATLGLDAGYAAVNVAAQPGVGQAELAARIATVIGTAYDVQTGAEVTRTSTDQIDAGLSFFTTFLLVFAAVSLFVGAFIVVNTFSMLISQRVRELALLRALGASRRQVTRSVLVEAVAVGLVGSVVGLALGLLLALGLRALLGALGIELPGGGLVLRPRTVAVSFAVGIGVTALAALPPARRAGTVAPVAALRDGAELGERSLRRRAGTGIGIGGAGLLLLALGLGGGSLPAVGAGVLLGFVGVAVLSPFVSSPVVRALALLLRPILGAPGRLGTQNALRNPRRTASTAAALTVGIALVSAFAVVGASVTATFRQVLAGSVTADVVVTPTGRTAGLPATVTAALRGLPGAAAVVAVRTGDAQVAGSTTTLAGLPADYAAALSLQRVAGSLTLGDGTVLLDTDAARTRHLRVGDPVTVLFPRNGARRLTLGGTYARNGAAGDGVVTAAVLAAGQAPAGAGTVYVKAAPGAEPALLAAATAALAADPTARVQTRADFTTSRVGGISTLLNLVNVLLLLSIVIAALGIINTLALSVVERTREIGLLRAVGLTRGQLRRSVRVEAVLIATYGGLLGIAVGALLGIALTEALDGISVLAVPVGRLIAYVVVAALLGVLAAVLPARRAARLEVLAAIATS